MKQLLTIFLLTITAITSLTLTTPQVEASTITLNWTTSSLSWESQNITIQPNTEYTISYPSHLSPSLSFRNSSNTVVGFNSSSQYSNYANFHSVIQNGVINIPSTATTFLIGVYNTNAVVGTHVLNANEHFNINQRDQISITTYSTTPPTPTFGTDTITWNYDPLTDELTATFTSTQPTYSANDITARGVITGDSRHYNSPADLSVNAGSIHPKTNGYTGTQTFTLTNIPRGESLYMRTYVQYNNQDHFYSVGLTVTPPNYAVRQLDFIDWNGFVLATYYPELYSTAQSFDTAVQSLVPAREGYVFNGFTGDTDITTELKVFQRTAQYTQLQSYTVTFVDWDNTVLGTDTVFEGQPASPPFVPTRTGYTFDSWLPPIADIQGNITTVAQYTPNTYLVTWNSDDVEVQATQLPHDSEILSHAPFVTYEGYAFQGWAIDPGTTLITSGQLITMPLSITAIWIPTPTYTVTWRDVAFNTLKIEYVEESGLATAPTYDPGSGFVLIGWTPDPTQPITENTIFVAQVENAPAPPTIPGDYNPISDLFGGVIGASVGAIMTLGTIDLYGIQLSAIIYLFVSMSLGLWILKAVRG